MRKSSSPRVDIHAVARRARVSVATVSRVVNGLQTVDARMATRVRNAVEELGYTPNTQARALVSGRTKMIGLIVTLITNPFFPELLQSFEELAAQRGYDVMVGSTSYLPNRSVSPVKRMLDRKVDGVAMMTFGSDEELLEELCEQGLPVVSVGESRVKDVRPILVDFKIGIAEAVQHLAVLGHRKIAFISGPLRVDNSMDRQLAFLAATRAAGIQVPKSYLIEGDHSMEAGFDGAERLLSLSSPPTAIVCSNDMTAIGVLHSVSARKLRVPKDISIIGYDDIHMAQFTVPPLTTVRLSCQEIATAALDALIADLEGTSIPSPRLISTRLIVRQSTDYAPRENAGSAKITARGRTTPQPTYMEAR